MILGFIFLLFFLTFLFYKSKLALYNPENDSTPQKILQTLSYGFFFVLFCFVEIDFIYKIIFLNLISLFFIYEAYLLQNSYLLSSSLFLISLLLNFLFGFEEGISVINENIYVNLMNYFLGGLFCLVSFIKRKFDFKKDFAILFDKVAMLILSLSTIVSLVESTGVTRIFYITLTFLIHSYFFYLGCIYLNRSYWLELILMLVFFVYIFINFESILKIQKSNLEIFKTKMQNK